jgi:hypothetical protein
VGKDFNAGCGLVKEELKTGSVIIGFCGSQRSHEASFPIFRQPDFWPIDSTRRAGTKKAIVGQNLSCQETQGVKETY